LQTISQLYEKSSAAEFGISMDEFCDLVAEVLARVVEPDSTVLEREQVLSRLHLEELVLSRGCARGNETAWHRFVSEYREKLNRAALAVTKEEAAARELAGSIYAELYGVRSKPGSDRSSKLLAYSGLGSLDGWLRSVLAQEYVNRVRTQKKFVSFEEQIQTSGQAASSENAATVDERLAECTDAVLRQLAAEERFLLAAYYLDERTLAEIGRMLAVHESTVGRRIEKITNKVRKQIIAALCSAGLSKRAAEELLKTDVRDISIDIRERLTQERQA
jgi:RNA polymerase sigma-70 factor, ECF subfamily